MPRLRPTAPLALVAAVVLPLSAASAQLPAPNAPARSTLLLPDRVWDGTADRAQSGWGVLVDGNRIAAVGPVGTLRPPAGTDTVRLAGQTLLPGLIEGHAHYFLHPYDETSWNDQVLKEPLSLRVARATVALRRTLDAGFTSARDLGTEGAGDADYGLKMAVRRASSPARGCWISNRAIVATGSYGPKGFITGWDVPQGAEEADGVDPLIRAVRRQIGEGADWIKVYADYRWGPER